MNRRDFLKQAGVTVGTLAAGVGGFGVAKALPLTKPEVSPEIEDNGTELIGDNRFLNGFKLLDLQRPPAVYANWQPYGDGAEPVWKVAQWSSRELLRVPEDVEKKRSITAIGNSCKKMTVAKAGKQSDLTLEVLGNTEYKGTPRTGAEPWVHLLVEQPIASCPRLTDLKKLDFHLEAKLLSSKLYKEEAFDPGKHAAQYQVFFYLVDRNKKSEGYGEMIWFGIPVYDNRIPFTERYEANDFAGSNMFICTLAHKDLCQKSAHDKEWITLEKDLLPSMLGAFEAAHKNGFMKKTKSPSDLYLTGMNMGWEVPGLLDVSLQVRKLSLRQK